MEQLKQHLPLKYTQVTTPRKGLCKIHTNKSVSLAIYLVTSESNYSFALIFLSYHLLSEDDR